MSLGVAENWPWGLGEVLDRVEFQVSQPARSDSCALKGEGLEGF